MAGIVGGIVAVIVAGIVVGNLAGIVVGRPEEKVGSPLNF
jgi:hypothetical protein